MVTVPEVHTVVRRANTPGASGYALAVLVSVVVAAVLLAVRWAVERDVVGLASALLVSLVYVTVLAVPTAPIGVLLVHLCCRRTGRQWVHVLVAGMAGVLTGLVFGIVVAGYPGLSDRWDLVLVLGVATAVGRAAVIPLRPPVDDDFRPERASR